MAYLKGKASQLNRNSTVSFILCLRLERGVRKRSREVVTFVVGSAALMVAFLSSSVTVSASAPAGADLVKPAIEHLTGNGDRRINARVAPDLCVAVSLPARWTAQAGDGGTVVLSAPGEDGEISISARSYDDLHGMPQRDPIERDAAFLQRDHEELMGRPAHAINLEAVEGASRWTATWIDPNLPSPSHMLIVETYILSALPEWLLEVSVSDIPDRSAREALVDRVLSGIKATRSPHCARMG